MIRWLGHAAFLITTSAGTRIITDPYTPSATIAYSPIEESADIVTVSHGHGDHSNVAAVRGNPELVRATIEAKGMKFRAIPSYHDRAQGKERGNNTIFCFEADGLSLCHLGDLGHPLDGNQVTEIGKVDVLLIPVGGNYTIDAIVASEVCEQLKPNVVIPMHFRNEKCTSPIVGVDEFLKDNKNVTRLETSDIEVRQTALPKDRQIIVPKPAN
ncbi:MAG: MBL fold metallo-hydrolase [Chloroflexota bacterium]